MIDAQGKNKQRKENTHQPPPRETWRKRPRTRTRDPKNTTDTPPVTDIQAITNNIRITETMCTQLIRQHLKLHWDSLTENTETRTEKPEATTPRLTGAS
jgi:hypothetical protein